MGDAMSLPNIIRISAKNCISKKGTTIQIIISLTISFILYICVFGYVDMLKSKLSDTTREYYASNSLFVQDVNYEKSVEIADHISENFDIRDMKITSAPFSSEEFCENTAGEMIIPAMSSSVLVTNGKEHKFLESVGRLYELNDFINIFFFDSRYSFIACNELDEYTMINGSKDPLLYGEYPSENQEVLLPECYADAYNIPAEDLVGKEITIKLVGENGEKPLIESLKVCGILNNNYFELSSGGSPAIMIYKTLNDDDDNISVQIYPKNYTDISKISAEIKEKYGIEADVPDSYDTYEYLSKQIVFADKVMIITAGMIIFSMLLNVLRIVLYSFKKRLKYQGMLRALGMRDGCILLIILFETVIETLISALLALVFSSEVMKYIFSYIAEISGTSADYNIISPLTVTRILMLSLSFWLIILAAVLFVLKRNSTTELLRR